MSSGKNTIYGHYGDREPVGDGLLCFPSSAGFSDSYYLFIRKFSKKSAFVGHVIHVLFVRSKKEVSRIYATRVVAFVEDMQSIFNFSVVNRPRKPMAFLKPLSLIGSASNPKIPVPTIRRADPIPAGICFLNMLKESVGYAHRLFKGHKEILPCK